MDPMLDEYLRKKYELDSEDNKDLRRASSESNFYNNIGRGLNTISSSLAGNKADNSFYDTLDAQSQQALGSAKDDRKMLSDYLMQKYKMDKDAKTEAQTEKRLQLDDWFKHKSLEQQSDLRKSDQEIKKMMAEAMLGQKQTQQQERHDRAVEQDVQKLSDKIGNAQDLNNALSNVESKLGFKLDDADSSSGSLLVNGKEADLPGVSIPGLGRVAAYSGDARQLSSAMQKVFNVELKDRSGAAVTNAEMERLKNEFAQGKFNTEPEMIQALKDYKSAVSSELKNREAGFRPEVVDTYRNRGGATYRNIQGSGFSANQEAGIKRVMDANGVTREEAIKALKDNGKL